MKKLLFLLLFVPCGAFATPSITGSSWSGSLDNGTAVTLTGSGFGTKTSTGSLVYETGESGSFDSYWASTGDTTLITVSTAQRSTNSSYTQYLNFRSGVDSARLEGEGTEYEKWFCSGFFKFDSNFDWGTSGYTGGDQWLSNFKGPWRLWETGASAENFYFQYAGDEDRLKLEVEGTTPTQTDTIISTWRTSLTLDVWHQFEFMSQDSTLNTADGTIVFWWNGVEKFNDTTVETRTSDNVYKRIHTMGFNDSWGVGTDIEGDQAPNEYWADDFYCDNTWSNVFVSTGSTFSAGGSREYALATAWSATSITFTLHEGAFDTSSQTLYAYVRDSAGLVNASGYELSSTPTVLDEFAVTGDISISGGLSIK